MASFSGLSDEEVAKILEGVFAGTITATSLPVNQWQAFVTKLSEGAAEGLGGWINDFPDLSPDKEVADFFQHNIQVFSAAKTHQQVEQMTEVLFDEAGFKRAFAEFAEDATEIFGVYNEIWLAAEFDTAVNAGFGARNWLRNVENADIAPLLRYQTVGDERVRPQHVVLDNIVKPVNHSFWNTHYPPNGWRCRCDVEQLFEGEAVETNNSDLPGIEEIPELFRHNPGKSKFIFDEARHPYFTNVSERFRSEQRTHFGLPVPPKPRPNNPQ